MKRNELTLPTISIDTVKAAHRSELEVREWTDEKIAHETHRYSMFLELARRHPGEALAPTRGIDAIWHLHMLHPVAYAEDCKRILGTLFDHDGGFGKAED